MTSIARRALTIVRQGADTAECRAVGHAAMLLDLSCKTVAVEQLADYAAALRSGAALPVGSVEFVRAAMDVAGVREPDWSHYPKQLDWMLRREVRLSTAGRVLGRFFVKPVKTKLWNGFVFDTMGDPDLLDQHDREQYDAFMAVDPDEPVWTSEPTRFLCEWRHYVCRGKFMGSTRYDPDGAEDAPLPDLTDIDEALRCMVEVCGPEITCALDVGVIEGGETALVEATDGWAIGLYSGALKSTQYLDVLATRWEQIIGTAGADGGAPC